MAGDVVAGDVEEQQVVEAGEEVGGEEGERVVLEEQLLQVGALLEDGRGPGGQVVVGETFWSVLALQLLADVIEGRKEGCLHEENRALTVEG